MKKFLLLSASSTALLVVSSVAYAYPPSPYLSINAGIGIPSDADVNINALDVTLEGDPGVALTGAGGYDFGSIRIEAALAYQKNDLDKIQLHNTGLSFDASGELTSIAGMINGYYQFLNTKPFTPFLTVGLGVGKVELEDFASIGLNFGSDDDTSLVYQIGAGCSYAITPKMAFDLQYRYVNAPDIELDVTGSGEKQEVDCATNNIYAGLRYNF